MLTFSSAQLNLSQCKYLQIRSVRMPRPAKNAPQSAGVPARSFEWRSHIRCTTCRTLLKNLGKADTTPFHCAPIGGLDSRKGTQVRTPGGFEWRAVFQARDEVGLRGTYAVPAVQRPRDLVSPDQNMVLIDISRRESGVGTASPTLTLAMQLANPKLVLLLP